MATNYLVEQLDYTADGAPDHTGTAVSVASTAAGVSLPDPGVVPQLADADAVNCSVYYSTDGSALSWKDLDGTVHTITVSA